MEALKGQWIGMGCLVLGMALAAGCSDGGSSPTEPSPTIDSAVLETVSPPAGTLLTAGSQVVIRGRIRYTLASTGSGTVVLVIQDQNGRSLVTGPQPSASIARGGGTVELTYTLQIPATGVSSVDAIFPLFPSGARESVAAPSVKYSVR